MCSLRTNTFHGLKVRHRLNKSVVLVSLTLLAIRIRVRRAPHVGVEEQGLFGASES